MSSYIKKVKLKQDNVAYLYIAPMLFFFLLYIAYPIIYMFYVSFLDWNGITPGGEIFVGLKNYLDIIFNDEIFHKAFLNTFIWTASTVVIQTITGFIFALLLNQKIKGRSIYRAIFFLPVTLTTSLIAVVWCWILNPEVGPINYILKSIGLDVLARSWLSDIELVLPVVILIGVWKWVGISIVIYLAALQTIPYELYEAAIIDGTNYLGKIRHVTIPLIASTTWLLIILSTIGSFKEFEMVYVMTRGGPNYHSQLLSLELYRNIFMVFKAGRGSAVGVIIFVIMLLFTVIFVKFSRRTI